MQQTFNRRGLWIGSALLIVGITTISSTWAAPRDLPGAKPNIILIVADDLGYADTSAYPHAKADDIQTPGIDRLALRGTRFNQGYVTSPVCSPSRLGFLTGRYPQRWNVLFYSGAHLPQSELTVADLLRGKGYTTGMIGKYHTVAKGKDHALDAGFDSFYGFNNGTQHYLIHSADGERRFQGGNLTAGPIWVNRERKDVEGYSTTLYQQQAVEFVSRNEDKPFFLYLSFSAAHLFIQIPEKDREERGIPPFSMWDPGKEPGRAGYLKWYYRTLKRLGDDAEPNDPYGRARYLVCLEYMDRAIGALLDKLKELNLSENTLVVFISDNGGSPRTYALNQPLRGWKYNLYEGGIRVPFIVRWPMAVPEGKTEDTVVSSLDILPTLVAAAGGTLPGDRTFDGINLLPLLRGEASSTKRTLFWERGSETAWAVRHHDWKLVQSRKEPELYDLADDIGESRNLADENPEIVQELTDRLGTWRQQIRQD